MAISRARIEAALQRPVVHLAYPYGDRIAAGPREFALARAAGFKTAVTTRPGMIFPESADHLTALPRVSLNGNYQDTAHPAGADLGRRDRDVERLSPDRRGVTAVPRLAVDHSQCAAYAAASSNTRTMGPASRDDAEFP